MDVGVCEGVAAALCVGVRDDVAATSSRRAWWVGVFVEVAVALGDLVGVGCGERDIVGLRVGAPDLLELLVAAPDLLGLPVACGDLVRLTGMHAPQVVVV